MGLMMIKKKKSMRTYMGARKRRNEMIFPAQNNRKTETNRLEPTIINSNFRVKRKSRDTMT